MPTPDDKDDMGNISTLVQNFPEQAQEPLRSIYLSNNTLDGGNTRKKKVCYHVGNLISHKWILREKIVLIY